MGAAPGVAAVNDRHNWLDTINRSAFDLSCKPLNNDDYGISISTRRSNGERFSNTSSKLSGHRTGCRRLELGPLWQIPGRLHDLSNQNSTQPVWGKIIRPSLAIRPRVTPRIWCCHCAHLYFILDSRWRVFCLLCRFWTVATAKGTTLGYHCKQNRMGSINRRFRDLFHTDFN